MSTPTTTGGTRFGLGISNCRPASQVVDEVRRAESLGAEIAFIAEDVNCRDAFQLAGLAASATATIRLATGVVNPYTRNPTSIAMAIATLDEVCGGRATLGIGSSSPSLIEGQMGIPHGKPVQVLREAVTIIRALLAGERVTANGERFNFRDAKLEVRPIQPRIPIYLAAMGPLALRLAGQIADGVLLNVGASTEYVRWAIDEIRIGAEAAGRDPGTVTIAAWLTVYVTDEYESGLHKARAWLAGMLSIPRQGELLLAHAGGDSAILAEIRRLYRAYPHSGDREAAAAVVPPELAERMALIGNVERVRERLEEYRQAGVQVPVLGPAAVSGLFGHLPGG